MAKVRVSSFAVSLDGYAAGPRQSLENPLGIRGPDMFGPVRGPWPDDSWKGWWGEEPPYHVPTFVLTHHARKSIEMKGGTTFHFVPDGILSALQRAKEAAENRDVRIGGGVATIQQYLRAIGESPTYLNYAVWESTAAFRAAFTHPEFKAKLSAYPSSAVASPHLFQKVAVPGICVA
jgi:dihydrofolate reductase